eukprot:gene2323-2673_t
MQWSYERWLQHFNKSSGHAYKNSHKLAKLRLLTKERFRIKTSNVHNETTTDAKFKHENQVMNLMEKLRTYSYPFAGPSCTLSTGIEISPEIVTGLLEAKFAGKKMHQHFYLDHVLSSEVGFLEPFKRSKFKTGLEKKQRLAKALSVLKENQQALVLICSQCHDKREAFSHCLTKYPLAIASPDGKLYQQGSKPAFRNNVIDQAEATIESPPLY